MEDDWNRLIKGRKSNVYPKDGEEVLVKIYHHETDKYYTLKAIFTDTEYYRSWRYKMMEGIELICLPEWWKYDR